MATAISLPANEIAEPNLKQRLARAERVNKLKSQGLILPLLLFVLLTFLVPIASLLWRSVENPEVVNTLPRTLAALAEWDGRGLPAEPAYQALAEDLYQARREQSLGDLSKRLNMELAGYRSLLTKTARAMPFRETPASYQEALEALDERWGDPAFWQVIQRNDSAVTGYYLLAALDHRIDELGELAKVSPDQAVYLDIFARTFWMGLVITSICLLLAYPLAYLLANLPARQSNLLMILVLLPFWTSILVRVAAWIVLLQSGGLINGALLKMGLIDEPLQLVFNRTGVYIAMVHILLPFMILPIYSVMKNISPSYMRAAVSLGCHPFASFWRVYFPQTLAGVGAGCLLVFIISIGYYITPALLGSPNDQMVSYFVAFYTNTTINWGMATALGGLLLLATMLLYVIYSWLVGASRLRLG
ncbi:ABC transporter permease [Stutzerimonas kunmingensis]|uniref:ABC transporter permease n=1 Tax=Stutzerimonas kunmingensis TaxID=1211807 RepID=UPI0028B0E42C|nr:ABC transporter permease [Stutzerimonas kunmingensis]